MKKEAVFTVSGHSLPTVCSNIYLSPSELVPWWTTTWWTTRSVFSKTSTTFFVCQLDMSDLI